MAHIVMVLAVINLVMYLWVGWLLSLVVAIFTMASGIYTYSTANKIASLEDKGLWND